MHVLLRENDKFGMLVNLGRSVGTSWGHLGRIGAVVQRFGFLLGHRGVFGPLLARRGGAKVV
eukprot:528652-Pyramimonas_sp.AAC.1